MSDFEILEMLHEIKNIYLDSSNHINDELDAQLKILSIDLIKGNDYYNITQNNLIPDKLYIKNQLNNKNVYIIIRNLKKFKRNKKSLIFLMSNDERISFKI